MGWWVLGYYLSAFLTQCTDFFGRVSFDCIGFPRRKYFSKINDIRKYVNDEHTRNPGLIKFVFVTTLECGGNHSCSLEEASRDRPHMVLTGTISQLNGMPC